MYQNVTIIGNLGGDPQMKYLPDGTPVTTFRVAVNRRWKNQQGEDQEKTTWFRVTTWRRLAETCNQYLTKGQMVLVVGEIDASAWTGQDGQPRASLELTARTVRFFPKGARGEGAPFEEGGAPEAGDEGELPF
jgi:single-strand DNA-binding protein